MSALLTGVIVALVLAAIFRPITDGSLVEDKRDKSPAFFTALEIFLWILLVPLGIGTLTAACDGAYYLIPVPILCLILLFPWQFATAVLVPLGLYRAAYFAGFFCLHKLAADRRGGALLLATWAAVTCKSDSDAALGFIESKLSKPKRLVRGAGVVAAALLAQRRGDMASFRALLASLESIDPSLFPPAARSFALTLRAIDRLAVGDAVGLRMTELLPMLLGWPHSRLSRLLVSCAMRIVRVPLLPGESAQLVSSTRLYLLWLLSPHRKKTRWLLTHATQPTPSEAPAGPPPASTDVPQVGSALERAVAGLRPLLTASEGSSAITAELLIAVGRSWDAVLADDAARRQVLSRSLVLGITSERGGEAALRSVRDEAVALMQAAITHAGLRLSGLGGAKSETLQRAVQKVRSQILDEVEGAGRALRVRVDDKRGLSAIDEWREWARYRALYEAAKQRCGAEGQRLAWPSFHREACHHAVWLWNDQKQRALGNCIFRFLVEEAELVGDERTADLQRTNVECGL